MSIKQKFNLLFLGNATAAVLIVGLFSYFNSRKALESQAYDGMKAALNSRITSMQHVIRLRKEQASLIANTYLARQLSSEGNNNATLISSLQQHIDFMLERMQSEKKSDVLYIGIRDRSGAIIANTQRNIIGIRPPTGYHENI